MGMRIQDFPILITPITEHLFGSVLKQHLKKYLYYLL